MKKLILSAVLLTLVAASCKKAEDKKIETTPGADTTAVVKDETPVTIPDSITVHNAMMAYATPGEPHKMFASENGNWDEEVTIWMKPDDPKPMKNKMTASSKMILGGRFQEMRHTGNFWGQPFEGVGTMAYNNAAKEIQSSWVDNMSTGIMYMSGPYDGTSKKMELKGTFVDPVTGKSGVTRQTYEIIDDNTRKLEMYCEWYDGKEYKNMEILMTRKK